MTTPRTPKEQMMENKSQVSTTQTLEQTQGGVNLNASKAIRKAEEKKRRKETRKADWEKLLKSRPDEKAINPKDEEEIRIARATLGTFHLKTAADYVVPEHLRSNTKQKRRQIAFLAQEIYARKKTFNKKVRLARDEKVALREAVLKLAQDLPRMQKMLPPAEHKSPPKV